ncbi:MAG: ABC-type transport auxiliary lipoprotein family protein [Candidatus Cloacimonadales bacterium]|nr:ABC-type transport auxiliary lipoprotein family protein [Candidatus Cloacimonadales bacterium]
MKKIFWLIVAAGIILGGCTSSELITKNYFILEYYGHNENSALIQKTPIAKSIYIQDSKISNTYNRSQIVIRHFGPRITYNYYNLWGVKLSKAIPDLIQKRMQSYNIFKQTHREFLDTRPDMEISTTVNNIEIYISENIQQARVNMSFVLRNSGEEANLVQYEANVEKTLLSYDYDTFVQTINDIILEETDHFIQRILGVCGVDSCVVEDINQTEEPTTKTEQLSDEEVTDESNGMLLLPALSRTDNEPYFQAINDQDDIISGKMGTPLILPQGEYAIRYGSGKSNQLMIQENIKIYPRYKTIIEPNWGCLVVEVIDKNRNYAKVRYEIFDLATGDSYGGGFPAEEEIGEQSVVWALKPGLYKITVNNEPFNTYSNFTTTYVEKGEVKKLTIVMDTDDEGIPTNMIGAGVLEESFLEASLEKTKFSSAIHGNVNINSDNEAEENENTTSIILDAQLQNYLLYDNNPVHYSMKNLIEIGTSKSTNEDFQLAADEFDLKNTAIYYFIKDFGVYGRVDANSHFFNSRYYSADEFYCAKFDTDGNTVLDTVRVDNVKVRSSFFPLILKEGLGINYRILNYSRANLSLRVGFGMRQEINNDVYQSINPETINGVEFREYHELKSESKTGTEMSLVGTFQLPLNLSYSLNADFLFPFYDEKNYTMELENVFNVKILKYISLDYKLKLTHKMPEIGNDYIARNHTLFLRVTYFLR